MGTLDALFVLGLQQRQTMRSDFPYPKPFSYYASSRRPSQQPATKRKMKMDVQSLLHNACKLYPTTLSVVDSALNFDPEGIRVRFSFRENKAKCINGDQATDCDSKEDNVANSTVEKDLFSCGRGKKRGLPCCLEDKCLG